MACSFTEFKMNIPWGMNKYMSKW